MIGNLASTLLIQVKLCTDNFTTQSQFVGTYKFCYQFHLYCLRIPKNSMKNSTPKTYKEENVFGRRGKEVVSLITRY